MKNRLFLAGMLGMILTFGILTISCKDDERDLRYSVQVNNQAASRAIAAEDTVELYIANMEYIDDANPGALIIIAANDRDQGSKGGKLNNAGWYSVTANLEVTNDVNVGSFSAFLLKISKMKVNGAEYVFPVNHQGDSSMGGIQIDGFAAVLGKLTRPMAGDIYPNNFNGITIDSSTVSLKTVLTVEPDILGIPDSEGYDSQGLAKDPFKFIKVEGRINE